MSVEHLNIENYDVRYHIKDEISYVQVTGTEDSKSAIAFINFVLDMAVKNEIRKVLIEEDLNGKLSLFETFKVSLYAIKIMFSSNTPLKIALIDTTKSKSHEYKFGENIFFNRGIRFLAAESIEQAEEWLRE